MRLVVLFYTSALRSCGVWGGWNGDANIHGVQKGFVMTWGTGYFGQLGHGDNASYRHPRLLRRLDPQRLGEMVIQVACGGYHSAVVTDAGRVFSWGFNRYGQCGNGSKDNTVPEPAPVDLSNVPPGRVGEAPKVRGWGEGEEEVYLVLWRGQRRVSSGGFFLWLFVVFFSLIAHFVHLRRPRILLVIC